MNENIEIMENNNSPKKNKGLIVIIVMLIIALLGTIGYILYDKGIIFSNKNNTEVKQEEKKEEIKQEARKQNVITKTVITENEKEENYYKVELTSNNEVIVNTDNIKDQMVEKNVKNAIRLQYGQSDLCLGNSIIMMLKDDNTISGFKLDDIVCGEESSVILNTKLNDLKGIVDVYNKKIESSSSYEPNSYNVLVKFENGTEKDITSYFN